MNKTHYISVYEIQKGYHTLLTADKAYTDEEIVNMYENAILSTICLADVDDSEIAESVDNILNGVYDCDLEYAGYFVVKEPCYSFVIVVEEKKGCLIDEFILNV